LQLIKTQTLEINIGTLTIKKLDTINMFAFGTRGDGLIIYEMVNFELVEKKRFLSGKHISEIIQTVGD